MDKVDHVVPPTMTERLRQTQLFALNFHKDEDTAKRLAKLRIAIRDRHRVSFSYSDAQQQHTNRTVRPLSLSFLAPIWMLTGWCEARNDYRNFRVDRMGEIKSGERFDHEPGKTLADCLDSLG